MSSISGAARSIGRLALGPFLAWHLLGCGGTLDGPAPADPPGCVGAMAQRIYGGDAAAPSLLAGYAAAIGSIETAGGSSFCTGTVVAPGRLLTAAHCIVLEDAQLRLSLGGTPTDVVLPLGVPVTSTDADLAVVELPTWSEAVGFTGSLLPMWTSALEPEVGVGMTAWLAGTGETERGTRGELRMVEERIATIDPDLVLTDGAGKSGACGGDSGGPLLRGDANGTLRVLGVLRDGSRDCMGVDRYTRLDVHAAWLDGALASGGIAARCK